MKFKKGPKTVAVGCTQASVSASNIPLPEVTVSVREDAIVGSIIDRDDFAPMVEAMGDVGATKAEAVPIIVAITQQRTTVSRYIFICFGIVVKNSRRNPKVSGSVVFH